MLCADAEIPEKDHLPFLVEVVKALRAGVRCQILSSVLPESAIIAAILRAFPSQQNLCCPIDTVQPTCRGFHHCSEKLL